MLKQASSMIATFGQLCVIAREQIERDPTIDDFEWRARIKDRLIVLKFETPPNTEAISRAMSAVERAHANAWGPRPPVGPPTISATPPAPDPPPLTRAEAAQQLVSIRRHADG